MRLEYEYLGERVLQHWQCGFWYLHLLDRKTSLPLIGFQLERPDLTEDEVRRMQFIIHSMQDVESYWKERKKEEGERKKGDRYEAK